MTEIFIEPELENLSTVEASAEWVAICEQLGMTKQLKVTKDSPTRQAPPYMPIDPKTSKIIKTLCPVQDEYKEYTASTIPLDILQEIAKCVYNGWYENIYIMSDNKSPDPFVVGRTKNSYDYHLIARWGTELLPWEILEKKAIARLKAQATTKLNLLKTKIEYALKNPEAFVQGVMNEEEELRLNFSIDKISRW